MDREKVIKGLECCQCPTEKGFVCECSDCPYYCGSTIKCRVMLKIDALALLKEQQNQIWEMQDRTEYLEDKLKSQPQIVRCKDCDNKECWGRAGDVVCGIDGTPHRPDWFCADGEVKE